jgi:hypothetical protein
MVMMMVPIRTTMQRPRRVSLRAGPTAPAEARNYVRATINAWDVPIDPYVAADNEKILLVISWADDQMRVEVHDTSRSEPVPVDAPVDAETGRGLMLVDSMSTGWGFYQTATGKAVYFTLPAEDDLGGDDRTAQGDRHSQADRRSPARIAASFGFTRY